MCVCNSVRKVSVVHVVNAYIMHACRSAYWRWGKKNVLKEQDLLIFSNYKRKWVQFINTKSSSFIYIRPFCFIVLWDAHPYPFPFHSFSLLVLTLNWNEYDRYLWANCELIMSRNSHMAQAKAASPEVKMCVVCVWMCASLSRRKRE